MTQGRTAERLGCRSPRRFARRSEPSAARTVERVTGAASVVRSLEEAGVEVVFGIPGGAVLPVYDPLLDSTRVRHVLVRHEQGAGHAATGYAQATGTGRRLHGDVRSGRHQPGHPDRRRAHGFGAAGRDHRPGRPAA